MIFTKSDQAYELASVDAAERDLLLKKLKARRNVAFWGSILGVVVILILTFSLVGIAGSSLKAAYAMITFMIVIGVVSIGLLLGSLLVDLSIKTLILATRAAIEPTAEQGADRKPDHVPS